MAATGQREGNSTADRALTILEMFTSERPVLSAAEIAAGLGTARSTAYRYLETLEASDFIAPAPHGGFQLGLKVLELARIARGSYTLLDLAVPPMQQLAAELNASVLLTRLAGTSAVCIECVHAPGQLLRLSYERGTVLPITAGASALALLSGMPAAAIRDLLQDEDLPKWTSTSLSTPDGVVSFVGAAVENGDLFVSQGMVDPNVTGIATPIHLGEEMVALSAVLPRPVASGPDFERAVTQVRATARLIEGRAARAA